tara:strand:+ start:87057 stop:87380 length:324 start_codon:yes stop_codon:yes gene_type:complete
MLAHDFYPESHQSWVGIVQKGIRVALNGDLRLEPYPGQWHPVPKGARDWQTRKNRRSVRPWAAPTEPKKRPRPTPQNNQIFIWDILEGYCLRAAPLIIHLLVLVADR